MNTRQWKPFKFSITIISMLCSSLLLASCGGGGAAALLSAGIGGTGIVFGTITGFGSVYVNGTRFETGQSQFIVDGVAATQDDLEVGMVVTLEVETEDGVFTGKAISVVYDDSVQGPVAATPQDVLGSGGSQKFFNVFGQEITIDQTATVFDATSFSGLAAMDLVEISGFRTATDKITATYVRKIGVLVPGVSEVELRGEIMAPLTATSFMLDGTLIHYGLGTEIEVNGPLAVGLLVEVEGVIQADSSVQADEIEEEEAGFGSEVDDVSMQGIISLYVSNADFFINGQRVDASLASFSPAAAASLLENGINVEVEGDIVGGVLIADEVELRDGESELLSFVSAIDLANNRFEISYAPLLGSVVVDTNGQTLFKDEGPLQLPNFDLNLMNIGDFVKVKGFDNGAGVTAEVVKRQDVDDSKLEGSVQSFIADTSITILGIEYGVDAATIYEGYASSTDFFNQLVIGDLLEIEDDEPADGIADEVEEES